MGQFGAQRDKLRPQMGLLVNHMAQLRAQMSQLGINQWPKGIKWSAVPSPCSTFSLVFMGGGRAAAPIGDKVL